MPCWARKEAVIWFLRSTTKKIPSKQDKRCSLNKFLSTQLHLGISLTKSGSPVPPGPPTGRDPAWGAHFHSCAACVNGLSGGMCGLIFIVKPVHQALMPRRGLSQQARKGQSDLGGGKPVPPWGSSEESSLPPSAPQALFQRAGWEESMDNPALRCAKPTQRLSRRHSNTFTPSPAHPRLFPAWRSQASLRAPSTLLPARYSPWNTSY